MKSTLLLCLVYVSTAEAAPALRHQVEQHGDFVMIGNTLGYDCDSGALVETPPDTVGACGTTHGDTGIDIFWSADNPATGDATANNTITTANASSTAMLALPSGAVVTYARLYWGAIASGATVDGAPAYTRVTLDRAGGFSQIVNADISYTFNENDLWYNATSDVTSTIVAQGAGAYRVSKFDSKDILDANDQFTYAGWSLIVFYQLASDPPRNLALFDDFALVSSGNDQTQTITGFVVPDAGFDARLGVFAFEGDVSLNGDQLKFNGAVLTDGQPDGTTNFFNSSRTNLGQPESNAGDLPLLSGAEGTLSGVDLDVVDISTLVKSGDTNATFTATTNLDTYWIGALVTSISTFAPDLSTSAKNFRNLSGGTALRPGDEIEYTIVVINTGNDASVNTVVTDALPDGLDYVGDSTRITQGAGIGAITDPAGDDAGEFDSATRTLTVRVGSGATATEGGSLQPGESVTIVFDAFIDVHAPSTIANQAVITAAGAKGSPSMGYNTDGNGTAPGTPPTTFTVAPCTGNADCTPPLFCAADIGACVECTATEKQACTPTTKGAVCFANTGECGCLTDADCASPNHCDTDSQVCTGPNNINDEFPGIEGGGCQAHDSGAAALLIIGAWLLRRRR